MTERTVPLAAVRHVAKKVEAEQLNVQTLLLQIEEDLQKFIHVQNLVADDPRLSTYKVLHDRMLKNVRALQLPLRRVEQARAQVGIATAHNATLLYLAEDTPAYCTAEEAGGT